MNKISCEDVLWTCGFTFKVCAMNLLSIRGFATIDYYEIPSYVDLHWGRVIHQTLPSSPLLTPPTRKGLGTKLPPSHLITHCHYARVTHVRRGLITIWE